MQRFNLCVHCQALFDDDYVLQGLYLDGASWNVESSCLQDLDHNENGCQLPSVHLTVQCIQLFFSQTLFDFKRLVSHSISPKFSGKIPYVLSKLTLFAPVSHFV